MWKFKKIEAGIPERNPHESEFFRLTNPAEAVVREFIQNALDARSSNGIHVRIYFGVADHQGVSQFLDGLQPHLSACNFGNLSLCDNISYLVLEDFETTGLNGDTKWPSDSNFSKFWHGEGTSLKRGRMAGRWGLGKTTFHMISNIRTFFGFTVRNDNPCQLLMGKALLRTHRLNGDMYNYTGYFTQENWEPVNDSQMINEFKKTFNINRGDAPGLSIVILLPQKEITYDNVLRAVMTQYFYAIIAGMVKVEIEESERRITLDKDTLISTALGLRWVGTDWENVDLREILNFVKSSVENTNLLELSILDPANPEITQSSFSNLAGLKEQFRGGEGCHFKVPVIIKTSNGSQLRSFYKIHLKRFQHLKKALEFYMRSGILIYETKTLGIKPIISLLIADEEPVAMFLGDCETPAHTDWNERTEGFKDKYENATRILRFIKNSVRDLVSILDEVPSQRLIDFLKEIFSIPVAAEKSEKEGEKTKTRPNTIPPPKEPLFNISSVMRGFTVTLNPKKTNIAFPLRALLKIAYDTRRGNPFKQYETFDFNLNNAPIIVTPQNCRILSKKPNELEIEITGAGFKLKVTGFDPSRDIVVNAMEIKP